MSAEEKRKVLLSVYHKSKQVYTEKEILALGAKEGINSNTVADINNSLVDDALVDKEKIGGSNYFWSFPAKKDRQLQIRHEGVLRDIEALKRKVEDANASLSDAKRGREDNEGDRPHKLARLADLTKEKRMLTEELEQLKENDPQALADLEKELMLVKSAAERWTDNLFTCKSYLTKKRGLCSKEAMKILGISSAFDYPEDKIPK